MFRTRFILLYHVSSVYIVGNNIILTLKGVVFTGCVLIMEGNADEEPSRMRRDNPSYHRNIIKELTLLGNLIPTARALVLEKRKQDLITGKIYCVIFWSLISIVQFVTRVAKQMNKITKSEIYKTV